jgi:Tfp pilus assembly protein PilN
MSKKPASIDINLVPKDPFFQTTIGRVLQWALSAGRYIVIFTELIVIVSFAARFTLDRQITDLNTQIFKSKSIIQSFGDLETSFRSVQTRLDDVKKIDQEENIVDVFQNLSKVTPKDVNLSQLSISPSSVNISGNTLSQESFNLLVNNLQLSGSFHNISISKIESGDQNKPGFTFTISANTKEVKRETSKQAPTDKVNILDRTEGI